MAANNMAMLIGHTGSIPEVRYLDNGLVTTKVSLAVNRPVKDKQGNRVTDWFKVEFWGKQAELAGELIKKGSHIAVTGAVQIEEWTDKEGAKRTTVRVKADNFQLLDSKAQAEAMAVATTDAEVSVAAEKPAKFETADNEEEMDEIPF